MAEPETSPPSVLPPIAAAIEFGRFRFDPADGVLRRDGIEVPLPPRALAVLALLVAHAGRLVPKQLLLDTVWSDTFVSDTSLAEAVSVVRQALGDDPQSPTYIQTVHRRGYRFIAAARAPLPAPAAVAAPPRPAQPPLRSGTAEPRTARVSPVRRRVGLVLGVAAAVLAGAVAGRWELARRAAAPAPAAGGHAVRRLLIDLPAGAVLGADGAPALALSPSGEQLVFVARAAGSQRLYRRALDQFEASPIAGTEGAAAPFFSPDGQWVGFFAQGKLERVALAGGDPLVLCDSPYPYGASWSEDGSILFAPDFASGLRRVPAAGGAPAVLTTPDPGAGEVGHRWPEVLPGGRAALLTVWRRGGWQDASVELLDLRSGRRTRLLRGGSDARWSPTGHLVFARGGGGALDLGAIPFDLGRLAVVGPAVTVASDVRIDPALGGGQFALARGGAEMPLVYLPGGAQGSARAVCRAGRGGDVRCLPLPARPFRNLALSPDGSRLALTVREVDRSEVWVSDVARGNLSRLTFEGDNVEPVWSPDGRWIAFASSRAGRYELYRVRADGGGPPERLLGGGGGRFPDSFSPDGGLLAFTEIDPVSGDSLWMLPLRGGAPLPFLRSAFDQEHARFSPDGRWLAYDSNESGKPEVYLRAFPGPGGKWQLSTDGGSLPAWSADGRRIFYRRGTALMEVRLRFPAAGSVAAEAPARVLEQPELDRFAVTPDGLAFLWLRRASEEPERLRVVLGFGGELVRLAPPSGAAGARSAG